MSSTVKSTSTVATLIEALEELRLADRILGSSLGTLSYVEKQQWVEMVGLPSADGFLEDQTVQDIQNASTEFLNAQAAVRRALNLLGVAAGDEVVELSRWSRLEAVVGEAFGSFITADNAEENVQRAVEARGSIHRMFDAILDAEPALRSQVEPLGGSDELGRGRGHVLGDVPYRPLVVIVRCIATAWLAAVACPFLWVWNTTLLTVLFAMPFVVMVSYVGWTCRRLYAEESRSWVSSRHTIAFSIFCAISLLAAWVDNLWMKTLFIGKPGALIVFSAYCGHLLRRNFFPNARFLTVGAALVAAATEFQFIHRFLFGGG